MIAFDCSKLLPQLEDLGEGSHKCGHFGGWIDVEHLAHGPWEVMWTTGKDTHSLFSTCFSAVFSTVGVSNVFKSALSMWPVRDESEQFFAARSLAKDIDRAFRYKHKKWYQIIR